MTWVSEKLSILCDKKNEANRVKWKEEKQEKEEEEFGRRDFRRLSLTTDAFKKEPECFFFFF